MKAEDCFQESEIASMEGSCWRQSFGTAKKRKRQAQKSALKYVQNGKKVLDTNILNKQAEKIADVQTQV